MTEHKYPSALSGETAIDNIENAVKQEFNQLLGYLPQVPCLDTSDEYAQELQLRPLVPLSIVTRYQEVDLMIPKPNLPSRVIVDTVAEITDIDQREITGHRRTRELVRARQVAVYLMRKHTDLSYSQIGKRLGDRDHTTIIHAEKRVRSQITESPTGLFSSILNKAEESLRAEAEPSGEKIMQPCGEVVIAIADAGLHEPDIFDLPVIDITDRQRELLGVISHSGLDWSQRHADPGYWQQYGSTAMARLAAFRQDLDYENFDTPTLSC